MIVSRTYALAILCFQASSGPWLGRYLQLTPSGIKIPFCLISTYCSLSHLVKPNFLLTNTFCLPGNLNLALLRASITLSLLASLTLTEIRGSPMFTRATKPCGLPKAPRIPVWSLSAPAHDNILLILTTWNGCGRILMWKVSLPTFLTRYLLAQIRPASRASAESCSYSSETKWMH